MKLTLSLGSNLPPRHQRVRQAISWLKKSSQTCAVSSLYETPEIHGKGDPYVNAVMIAEYECRDVDSINRIIKEYEISAGRDDAARSKGIVPIDIDIVLADSELLRPRDFDREFFQIGLSELLGSHEEH